MEKTHLSPQQALGQYSLATGAAAVRRLSALHRVYSPAGRRILLRAGLKPGMNVADLGCGVGATTQYLSELVGPAGHVTGVDVSEDQLEQGRHLCRTAGITNASFLRASATDTGLPRDSFDLVYCRFLLLHLTNPAACLREMRDILKPGGILVVEDGDLNSAGSRPLSSLGWFSDLFSRLGTSRGLNYSLETDLWHMVKAAGFQAPEIEVHQPVIAQGEERFMLVWSIEEAASSIISAGLVTETEIQAILNEMDRDTRNPDILVVMPRMSLVWARKELSVL